MIFSIFVYPLFKNIDGNMETINVFSCCIFSFLAVFILLGVLALLIKLVDTLFPEETGKDDGAAVAAVHAVIGLSFPGARVTNMEEIQK